MNAIKNTISLLLRVMAVLMIFGGPVYGVTETRIEGKTTLSSGAGLVLLSALQRAR